MNALGTRQKSGWSAGGVFCLLTSLLLLAACGPLTPAPVQKRYVWPPAANAAKIEYLGFFLTENDLRRDHVTWLEKYVFGQEISPPVFKKPFAVAAGFGKVVVTDTVARQVVLLDLARKTIAPLALADENADKRHIGQITSTGVAFAGPEELWLVDSTVGNVVRCGLDGRLIGRVGKGELTRPTALAVDRVNRRAVVVDTAMHRLAVFSLDGVLLNYLGRRGREPGQFNYPLDADFDADGDLYVLDAFNARVQRFHWDGSGYRYRSEFGEHGTASGSFQIPKALAVTRPGHVYITDSLADKVTVFDRDGTFLLTFGGRFVSTKGQVAPGGLNMPAGIAADENDGIWIADTLNGMVHRFQYLNEAYLRDHPISAEQVVQPSREALSDKTDNVQSAEGKR